MPGSFGDWAGRIARWTRIASAKSDGSCAVEGRSIPGGPAPRSIPSRLLSVFGVRSVPPAGLECLEVRTQGAVDGSTAAPADSKQYGPSDLAEDGSETALYNKDNARAVVAKGADVIVNEGAKKVATDTTPTASGTFAITSVPTGAGTFAITLTWVDNDGVSHVIGTWVSVAAGTTGSVSITGKVDGGDPNFFSKGP